jgi:hypothetical protein
MAPFPMKAFVCSCLLVRASGYHVPTAHTIARRHSSHQRRHSSSTAAAVPHPRPALTRMMATSVQMRPAVRLPQLGRQRRSREPSPEEVLTYLTTEVRDPDTDRRIKRALNFTEIGRAKLLSHKQVPVRPISFRICLSAIFVYMVL